IFVLERTGRLDRGTGLGDQLLAFGFLDLRVEHQDKFVLAGCVSQNRRGTIPGIGAPALPDGRSGTLARIHPGGESRASPAYPKVKEMRIDRDRAIRTAALAALILVAVTFLPDLLRSPEPPAIPPDVGFAPGKPDATSTLPGSGRTAGSRIRAAASETPAGRLRTARKVRRDTRQKTRQKSRRRKARKAAARRRRAHASARGRNNRSPSRPPGGP